MPSFPLARPALPFRAVVPRCRPVRPPRVRRRGPSSVPARAAFHGPHVCAAGARPIRTRPRRPAAGPRARRRGSARKRHWRSAVVPISAARAARHPRPAHRRHPARPRPSRFPRSIFPRRFARILAHQSVFRAICSSRVSVLPGRARSASRRASSPRRSSSQRFQMSATVGKYGDSLRYRFTARSTMSGGKAARSSAQSSARIRSCAGVLPACG